MTIRSMPPASSHLAERPVPAPPPMMGWPRVIIACSFSMIARRAIRGMDRALLRRSGAPRPAAHSGRPDDVVKRGHRGRCEFRIIDVERHTDQTALRAAPKMRRDRIEQ